MARLWGSGMAQVAAYWSEKRLACQALHMIVVEEGQRKSPRRGLAQAGWFCSSKSLRAKLSAMDAAINAAPCSLPEYMAWRRSKRSLNDSGVTTRSLRGMGLDMMDLSVSEDVEVSKC